jgi:hypothetical protein
MQHYGLPTAGVDIIVENEMATTADYDNNQ